MKKLLTLSLVFLILTSLLPLSAFPSAAADPVPVVVGHTGGVVTEADVDAALTAAGLNRWNSTTPFFVTFAPGVTSIGERAFVWCTSLTSVVIPNSVASIGDLAFIECRSLTSVVIPNSVTSIGDQAFSMCASLNSVVIGNSVTSIGEWAFSGCTSLTGITVNVNNPNYASIDGALFNKNLTELIQYPIGNTRTTYTIPSSVRSIGTLAFSGCDSLTEIIISNSVTTIGYGAFAWCTSLTNIEISNSVTTIGEGAFAGCTSLTEIIIPNSVTSIGDEAFIYSTSLTSVVIGNSVTSIGASAFVETSLTGVVIPNSVTTIGIGAFSGTRLTSVVIPDSVISLGDEVFADCRVLTSVVIGNSFIGDGMFQNCILLTSVVIGNSVTSIGSEAFRNCTSLTSIVIPDSVTSIGRDAFRNCTNLYDVYFKSETPPTVGTNAFNGVKDRARAIVPHWATAYGTEGLLWNGLVVLWVCRVCGEALCVCITIDGDGRVSSNDVTLLRRYIDAVKNGKKAEFLDENKFFREDNAAALAPLVNGEIDDKAVEELRKIIASGGNNDAPVSLGPAA